MADFSPWTSMGEAPSAPTPSESGTKRDFANMLNEKTKLKKKQKMTAQNTLAKKLKLDF